MSTVVDGRRVRCGGHHLPSMFRFDFGPFMFTRACVPVDEKLTRVFYFQAKRKRSRLAKLGAALHFHAFNNWALNTNFSSQDYRVMAPQRWDTPEKLSGTDAEVIAWRKLLLTARGMPKLRESLPSDDPEP